MVGYVPAGDEAPTQVGCRRSNNGVPGVVDELQSIKPVLVWRRVPVLRRTAVVDGDDGGGEFLGESTAEGFEGAGIGGAVEESAAVEVNNYW